MLLFALALAAAAPEAAAEPVHVYTSEELDRRYGRLPSVSDPVDRSGPADWVWVEQFLDRQYARIEADRDYDLKRREADLAARPAEEPRSYGIGIWGGYYGYGYGYGYGRAYGYGRGHGYGRGNGFGSPGWRRDSTPGSGRIEHHGGGRPSRGPRGTGGRGGMHGQRGGHAPHK